MNFLDNIKEKNQFPILFIGSGITQRYFKNAPTWEQLLLKLWLLVDENEESKEKFYQQCNLLRNQGLDDFAIHLTIADRLEKSINDLFNHGQLTIENLDSEKAYKEKISPYRQVIANLFMDLEFRDGVDVEVKSFTKMLTKARFVITTNYDCFIENCFKNTKNKIDIKVGSAGLFKRSNSYGELYKIHGTATEANSICITNADYKENESKLALVNAKILSNLMEAPILFLGYSVTDENIRSLLKTYAQNLPFNPDVSAKRICVVEWKSEEEKLVEFRDHAEVLNMHYTRIQTDNFLEIYNQISKIDQGYSPAEIAKYEHAFRRIVEVKGAQKGLGTVLTTFEDLSRLSDSQISQKNLVVAFGDGKHIYKMPTYAEYIRGYFTDENELTPELALIFLSKQPLSTFIPINKYLKAMSSVQGMADEKEKVKIRVEKMVEFSKLLKNVRVAKESVTALETKTQPLDIYNQMAIKEHNRLNYITQNIKKFNLNDIDQLIEIVLETKTDQTISKTEYRRLFMAYSFLKEKKP